MILARESQGVAARSQRRLYPIHFYTGRNGASKSLAAVYDTLPTLAEGRPVLSTVRLLDFDDPRPCADPACVDSQHPDHGAAHPLYVPFTRWEQLLAWSFGDVVMDEITGVADSNESAALPGAVGNFLAQMRRSDVAVRVTGLSWIRAHKRLREAVVAVTRCQSSMPTPARKAPDGTVERIWRPRRLARWVTYDAKSMPIDDHTESMYDKADKLCRARHWIPTSPAITAYDTYAPVLAVGTVTDSGRCAYCGGTRRAPECSCADYHGHRSARAGGRSPLAGEPARSGRHGVVVPIEGGGR